MLDILVGMVASGKSTYCRKQAKAGAIIVNDDAVCYAVHARDFYDPTLKGFYKTIENAIIRAALLAGRNVIVDRPNLCRRTRAKYVSLAREFNAQVRAVVFPIVAPMEHAQRRFLSNNRGIPLTKWEAIVESHFHEYECLKAEEGFDEIIHLVD